MRDTKSNRRVEWDLVGLFMIATAHVVAYSPFFDIPGRLPRGLESLTDIIPLWVLSTGWFLVAVGLLVAIFRRKWDWAVIGLLVTMLLLWGLFYAIGWLILLTQGTSSRTYLVAAIYVGLALYIMGDVSLRRRT